MRHPATLFAILLAVPTLAQTPPPEIPFDAPADYFTYPAEMNLGEITGVAVNSRGHVFMVSRSNATGNVYGGLATQLLEFDARGRFVREIGRGLYGFAYGHAVRVDPQDNIWVVDKGTNMVIRFNPAGRVTMVLGRREEATDEHEYHTNSKAPAAVDGMFNQPTDVAWDADGNIYISDGYINSRVAKYDKNGAWVKTWGTYGYQPGQFRVPHNIAVDAQGRVYVADRGNGRLQVFDGDGQFLKEIIIRVPAPPGAKPLLGYQAPPAENAPEGTVMTYRPGAPAAICIPRGSSNVMYVADLYPGRIYKATLDGEVLGVLGRSGKQAGEFGGVHGLACPSEDVIYTAEFINWRSQKLMLRPARPAGSGARSAQAPAATLRVIASNGIKEALEHLQPEIERAAKARLDIEWGASNVLRRSIEGGAPFDLTIVTPTVIAELEKGKHVTAASRVDLARSDLAIGVRSGSPTADISTPEALKRRLLAARSVTYAREGAATGTFNEMMATLGITDAMQSKIVLQPPSVRPSDTVANGQNEMVFAPVSELLLPGIQVLGIFPKEFQRPLIMTGAVSARAAQPAAAAAVLAFISSDKAVKALKAAGMEPMAIR